MKGFSKVLKIIIPLFTLLSLVSGYIFFFNQALPIKEATSGFGAFDLRFSYTADNVMTVLSHFNGERNAMFHEYFKWDYVFCGCYSVVAVSIPILVYIGNDRHYLFFRSAIFSALASLFFNITENILLINIIDSFPIFTDGDANLASGITTLKWAFLAVWAASLILFLFLTLVFPGDKKNKQ